MNKVLSNNDEVSRYLSNQLKIAIKAKMNVHCNDDADTIREARNEVETENANIMRESLLPLFSKDRKCEFYFYAFHRFIAKTAFNVQKNIRLSGDISPGQVVIDYIYAYGPYVAVEKALGISFEVINKRYN